jgi:signal transduction histidine kinase
MNSVAANAQHSELGRGRLQQSEFVALASLSAQFANRAGDDLSILLTAAQPRDDGFPLLRPLWAREALHRALCILELFAALRCGETATPSKTDRHCLALRLASVLTSLETVELTRIVPCSGALREVAHDLVALFEPAIGRVMLDIDVATVSLAAYRRRALVLLVHNLIANALLHAFEGREIGCISLRLERMNREQARLVVGDDGIGFVNGHSNPATSVAGSLSDLLEAEIEYSSPAGRGTQAAILFPLL